MAEMKTGEGATATESRKVGKGRRKRRYTDEDGHGANSEPELGPRGPTLKKQALKGFDGLDLCQGLHPADSGDTTQHFEWERETRARVEDSFSEEYCRDINLWTGLSDFNIAPDFNFEAMDPAGSPSSIRKVADTARPSSSSPSAAPVPGWRSFFCLGNGK